QTDGHRVGPATAHPPLHPRTTRRTAERRAVAGVTYHRDHIALVICRLALRRAMAASAVRARGHTQIAGGLNACEPLAPGVFALWHNLCSLPFGGSWQWMVARLGPPHRADGPVRGTRGDG